MLFSSHNYQYLCKKLSHERTKPYFCFVAHGSARGIVLYGVVPYCEEFSQKIA